MEISTFSPGYSAFMHFSAHSVGGGWFFFGRWVEVIGGLVSQRTLPDWLNFKEMPNYEWQRKLIW